MQEEGNTPAELVLFTHTVVISAFRSECGNCFANAIPDEQVCRECGTKFVFAASSTQRKIGETEEQTVVKMEEKFPNLIYIGRASYNSGYRHWSLKPKPSYLESALAKAQAS